MSKDMMRAFELYQPDSVDNAVELLGRLGTSGWALAGGNDTLDWFKDRAKFASGVVDLSGVEELRGIRETADGVEIGALTTLTEIERSEVIGSRYAVLGEAARRVARGRSSMSARVTPDHAFLRAPSRRGEGQVVPNSCKRRIARRRSVQRASSDGA